MNYPLPANYNNLSSAGRKAVRLQYVDLQRGMCCYCGKPLNHEPVMDKKINWNLFPPHFMSNPVHLHHNHDTGETIGAVHAYCNAVLWQYHGK